jgi:hypothetical protein
VQLELGRPAKDLQIGTQELGGGRTLEPLMGIGTNDPRSGSEER